MSFTFVFHTPMHSKKITDELTKLTSFLFTNELSLQTPKNQMLTYRSFCDGYLRWQRIIILLITGILP